MSVNALGNPLRFILTDGEKHDITHATELIEGLEGEYVIAARGYDADEFRGSAVERGSIPVIPPRLNRNRVIEYDEYLYGERRLVEHFISKIKQYRRVLTRYDKLAQRYLGLIQVVSSFIWLR